MALKRTKWDKVFSDYIRERDGWKCQRCSRQYNKHSPSSKMGIHCSHFVGRANYKTRFEPANAMAICYGCHRYLGSNPIEHEKLWKRKFPLKERKKILELKNNIQLKKRDIETKENYEKLKLMLKEVSNGKG